MENHLQLNAVFVEAPEGGLTGYFVEFPEAVAEGENQAEVETNLLEALKMVLEYKKEVNENDYFEGKTTKRYNLELA